MTAETTSPLFDAGAGAPCLAFSNTVSDRLDERPRDHLAAYGDLVSWAEQAGLVSAEQAARLEGRAARDERRARTVLAEARALREAIYRLFSRSEEAADGDLEILNAALPEALARLRLAPSGHGYRWHWSDDGDELELPLWAVARSAAELLTSEDAGRVRQCFADDCAWLFVDRSRNRSRRWCDMSQCGNRHKARRHYRRRCEEAASGKDCEED